MGYPPCYVACYVYPKRVTFPPAPRPPVIRVWLQAPAWLPPPRPPSRRPGAIPGGRPHAPAFRTSYPSIQSAKIFARFLPPFGCYTCSWLYAIPFSATVHRVMTYKRVYATRKSQNSRPPWWNRARARMEYERVRRGSFGAGGVLALALPGVGSNHSMQKLIGWSGRSPLFLTYPRTGVDGWRWYGVRVGGKYVSSRGDITGNQGQAGAGHAARAVGVGVDLSDARARARVDWSVTGGEDRPYSEHVREWRRRRINHDIASERALADRLLAIGQWAASRAARRLIEQGRGKASDTSLADAASDAVASVLSHVRRLDKLTDGQWADHRVLSLVRLYAARGAGRSLSAWAVQGLTGDRTFAGSVSWSDLTVDLAEHRADDHQWFHAERSARVTVVRWIYRVGFYGFKATLPTGRGVGQAAAVARATVAARSRCRVLANIILGQSLADSCAVSGFGTVKAWIESCKGAGLFDALRASRVASLAASPGVEHHASLARAYGIDVGILWRELASLGGGVADAVRVVGRTDRQAARGKRGTVAASRVLRRRAVVRELSSALDSALWHKARAAVARVSTLQAFDAAMDGLHSDKWGDLRLLAGLVNKRGAVTGASKIDGAAIRAARGKVASKPTGPRTVAATVGKGKGKRDCAVSLGVKVRAMDGPLGFIIR